MFLDRAKFFSSVRSTLFGGRLTEAQVQGMDALLDEIPAGMPVEHVGYALATTFHETGRTMQPVVENLNYTSAARIRAVWPTRFPSEASAKAYVRNPRALANKVYGSRMGNLGGDDGWNFRGRGDAQLTGRDNYARATRELGVDFLTNPDLAAHPKYAAQILYRGMSEGWFTTRKLSQYFRPGLIDPYNARDIINPDKTRKENGSSIGQTIAGYYHKFTTALKEAGYVPLPEPQPVVEDIPVAAVEPVPAPASSDAALVEPAKPSRTVALLTAILESLFGRKSA